MAYTGPLPLVVKAGGTGLSTAGTSGTLLQSNGTTFVNTTATYPGTAGTTGTILRSDGTNFVNTTATYPTTTTINQVLYSSAANTISGLATANSAVLATNASGVPSITATPTVTSITFGSGSALNTYVGLTSFTPTIAGATVAGTATYVQQLGRYARIGNMVYVGVVLQWSATTGSGRMRINGLPYTADGGIQYQSAAQFGGMTLTANYTNMSFQTLGSTTSAEVQISGSGQASNAYNIQASGYVGWCCWYSV